MGRKPYLTNLFLLKQRYHDQEDHFLEVGDCREACRRLSDGTRGQSRQVDKTAASELCSKIRQNEHFVKSTLRLYMLHRSGWEHHRAHERIYQERVARMAASGHSLEGNKVRSTLQAKAQAHRERVDGIMQSLHEHQVEAAQRVFATFRAGHRAVILAAEMQSGKSGVAMALACLQRLSRNNRDMCSRAQLKDTLFVLTMPDSQLLEQAERDLAAAQNVVVTNTIHFERAVESEAFAECAPRLIIVDECHYGSSIEGLRYRRLFDYLSDENPDCLIVFISATPLSALLAAEEALVVNRQIGTGIVFHKASEQYHGVRQMLASRQVRGICNGARYFDGETSAQQAFHRLIRLHKGAGWALVRVPPGMALKAKEAFIADGIEPSNVMIIGRNLSGMDDEPQYDIDDFKRRYDEARQFGDKLVAITVASCRAGINFGTQMKEELIGTWDSTISNIAAVVQANIGRACGYHDNNRAVHFTNLPAVKAYAGVLDVLEERCKNKPSSKVASLRMAYEAICREHDVRGLDVGAQVRNGDPLDTQPKVTEVYKIRDYVVVRARLEEESPKYGRTVRDPLLRNSIEAIRQILLGRDGVPSVCTHRRLRGASWLTVSWVNGDTYDNQEKAAAVGTYKARCRKLIDDDPSIRFNDLVPIGGGVQAEEKTVAAMVFSIYNASRRAVDNPCMSQRQLTWLAKQFGIEKDDTLIVLVRRGEKDEAETQRRKISRLQQLVRSPIVEDNHFVEC